MFAELRKVVLRMRLVFRRVWRWARGLGSRVYDCRGRGIDFGGFGFGVSGEFVGEEMLRAFDPGFCFEVMERGQWVLGALS